MTYTVTVTAPFNRSCPTCRNEARAAASGAVDDPQVTSFTLRPTSECDHIAKGKPSPAATVLPGQQLIPGLNLAAPNGFDTQA